MKNFKRLFLPVLLFTVFACSTVEEENDTPATAVDASGNVVSKVDDGTVTASDSMNFLTLISDTASKTWKTSLFTLNGSTTFTSCRLDDIMMFFPDGTYNYQGGGQLCGAEDNQSTRNGNWEIDYTNRKIIFDKGSGNEYVADVIGLTANELRVKGTYMGMEVRGLYIKN